MMDMVPVYIFPQSVVIAVMLLPLLHYLADFELQTNWMAVQKSKRLDALFVHVMTYGAVFGGVFGWKFGVVTFVTHFITDFLTSKWSRSKFPWIPRTDQPRVLDDCDGHKQRSRHRFFCVIGFDQMIHAYSLILSVIWLQPSLFGGLL